MRIAVIGAGNNGTAHARRLTKIEDVEAVGATDPEVRKAEALVAEVGGRAGASARRPSA